MILSLDTSTTQAGVAVVDPPNGDVRAVVRAAVTTHSEALLTMIDEALGMAGITLGDIDVVACGGGPGSFTGLRIGLATAKGLCLALSRPLVLVSSLASLASRCRGAHGTVVACLDAFKGEVYAGIYHGEPPIAAAPERVLAPALLINEMRALLDAGDGTVALIGDGMVRYPELRLEGLAAIDIGPPDPVDVARLGLVRWQRGEHDDLATASPSYIRPSEAELVAARALTGA